MLSVAGTFLNSFGPETTSKLKFVIFAFSNAAFWKTTDLFCVYIKIDFRILKCLLISHYCPLTQSLTPTKLKCQCQKTVFLTVFKCSRFYSNVVQANVISQLMLMLKQFRFVASNKQLLVKGCARNDPFLLTPLEPVQLWFMPIKKPQNHQFQMTLSNCEKWFLW